MSIPTKAERILSYYSSEYPLIKDKINNAILHGYQQTSNKGNVYLLAVYEGYAWPNEELITYLTNEYKEAGWNIYFERDDDDDHRINIEIYEA